MNFRTFTFLILSSILIASSGFTQTVYRIRMADSTYSAQLRGVTATRTAAEQVDGTYETSKGAHKFPITVSGRYELWVDPLGGSNYSRDTGWQTAGLNGKTIPGSDFADLMEKLNDSLQWMSHALGDTCIDTRHIKSLAVTTAKIFNSAVTEEKINDSAVSNTKLANDAVTTEKIKDGEVKTVDIHDKAVTAEKLADGAVEEAKIASTSIGNDKIKNDAITTEKILDGEVKQADIHTGAVTTIELLDATIAWIDLDVDLKALITAGGGLVPDDVTLEMYEDGGIDKIRIKDAGVDSTKIKDGNVSTPEIRNKAIVLDHLSQAVLDMITAPVSIDNNFVYLDPDDDIQTAIDTVKNNSATNWFYIILTPGDYTLTSTLMLRPYVALTGWGDKNDVRLVGNFENSLIKADSGHVIMKNFTVISQFEYGTSHHVIHCSIETNHMSTIAPVYLENLRVEMNFKGTLNTAGIYIGGGPFYNYMDRRSRIKDCVIQNTYTSYVRGIGIYIENTGGSDQKVEDAFIISGCHIVDCFQGTYFSNCQNLYTYVNDCVMLDCDNGIYTKGTTGATENDFDLYITGCDVSTSGLYGIYTKGASGYEVNVYVRSTHHNLYNDYTYAYIHWEHMYANLYVDSPLSVILPADTWKKVDGMTVGKYKGMYAVGDSLKTYDSGQFEISVALSFKVAAVTTIKLGVFKNNTLQTNLQAVSSTESSKYKSLAIEGIIELTKDDYLSIRMMNVGDGTDPTIEYGNFTARSLW